MNSNRSSFNDHFSTDSENYSNSRPGYPNALFNYLASLSRQHTRAWDCATGTGQSALGLAEYYLDIIATDASSEQIRNASEHPHINYRVASAENSGIQPGSIDLITVAQALHWFDLDAFELEARRVLKPGGLLASWTYNLLSIRPDIDSVINDLYHETLNGYWPAEREIVENAYRDIQFHLDEIPAPEFNMEAEWNLQQLAGYLSTWSAVKRYQADTGIDPVQAISQQLLDRWEKPEHELSVRWPLTVKIWKKPSLILKPGAGYQNS